MTYCVGMLVNDGLAMIADTRTNAGVDNISSYKKLHVTEVPGERIISICTAGNLSVTQTALAMVAEGIKMPGHDDIETLENTPACSARPSWSAMRSIRSARRSRPRSRPTACASRPPCCWAARYAAARWASI